MYQDLLVEFDMTESSVDKFFRDLLSRTDGLLCLIALIFGVIFGHLGLKTNRAKFGLWLCWFTILILLFLPLFFSSLGWFGL
jgi:hypothetical protein